MQLENDADYDAIVCDVMMPGIPGWEFKNIVDKRFPALAPHLIFISGGAITVEAEIFLNSVQDRLLQKPFSMSGLEQRLLAFARPPSAPAGT